MRILFVSYYFAPFNSVGAVRATRLAELLERLGNRVFVLSARDQPFTEGLESTVAEAQIARTAWHNLNAPVDWLLGGDRVAARGYPSSRGNGLAARLGALYRYFVHLPDAQAGWYGPAVKYGRSILARGAFDLIYASASPFTSLLVASALSRTSGVPWVAELRDLWTDNHDYDYPGPRRWLEAAFERRVLRSARGLVTVSADLAQKLARRFAQPVAVVANGFDAEELTRVTVNDLAPPSELEIVYTGRLYDRAYDTDALLRALGQLGDKRDALRLRFFGRGHGDLEARASREGLQDITFFSPTVSRAEALRMQRRADVLLFFCWTGPNSEGVLSAKIFEYLGARRPILGIGDATSTAGRLIAEQGFLVSRDPLVISAWLRERVAVKRARGREPDLPAAQAMRYSREHQARELDGFLRGLMPQGGR